MAETLAEITRIVCELNDLSEHQPLRWRVIPIGEGRPLAAPWLDDAITTAVQARIAERSRALVAAVSGLPIEEAGCGRPVTIPEKGND